MATQTGQTGSIVNSHVPESMIGLDIVEIPTTNLGFQPQ